MSGLPEIRYLRGRAIDNRPYKVFTGSARELEKWSGRGTRPHRAFTEAQIILHGTGQARSAGGGESPCVHAANFPSSSDEWSLLPQPPKAPFSLLDRARPVFSFRRGEKRKWGGASAKPSSWLKSPLPVRAGTVHISITYYTYFTRGKHGTPYFRRGRGQPAGQAPA